MRYARAVLSLAVLLVAWPVSAQTARVTADRAAVRARPASSGAIVATVTATAELDVLEVAGTWLRVRVRATGVEGFIPAAFVQQTEAAPSSPPGQAPETGQTGAPAAAAVPPARTGAYRGFLVRAFAGLWSAGGGTGLQAGGGFAVTPFSNQVLELAVDAAVVRVSETNSITGSGDVIYNFVLPTQKFTPFAGAGVTFLHTPQQTLVVDVFDSSIEVFVGGGTNVALQLLGGIELPLDDRRALRGELRLQFLPGATSMALLGAVSF